MVFALHIYLYDINSGTENNHSNYYILSKSVIHSLAVYSYSIQWHICKMNEEMIYFAIAQGISLCLSESQNCSWCSALRYCSFPDVSYVSLKQYMIWLKGRTLLSPRDTSSRQICSHATVNSNVKDCAKEQPKSIKAA